MLCINKWLFIRGHYGIRWCQLAKRWLDTAICRNFSAFAFVQRDIVLSFMWRRESSFYRRGKDKISNGCWTVVEYRSILGFCCWRWPINSFCVWAELEVRNIVCCVSHFSFDNIYRLHRLVEVNSYILLKTLTNFSNLPCTFKRKCSSWIIRLISHHLLII